MICNNKLEKICNKLEDKKIIRYAKVEYDNEGNPKEFYVYYRQDIGELEEKIELKLVKEFRKLGYQCWSDGCGTIFMPLKNIEEIIEECFN